jgi:hypothetical protein
MCALAEHFSFRSPPVVPSLGFDFEVTGIAHHRVHCHGRAQRLTAPRAPVHDKLVTAVIWHQLGNDILGSGANRDSDVEARLMTTPHLNDNPIGVPPAAVVAAAAAPRVTRRSRSWLLVVAVAVATVGRARGAGVDVGAVCWRALPSAVYFVFVAAAAAVVT